MIPNRLDETSLLRGRYAFDPPTMLTELRMLDIDRHGTMISDSVVNIENTWNREVGHWLD